MAGVVSLVDPVRCYMLWQFLHGCMNLPGAVAEVGVYKGGTALLFTRVLSGTGKTLHLFDTFRGMPTVDPKVDVHRTGDFNDASEAAVRKLIQDPHAQFHVGFFPDTAKGLASETFCFVHVDADIRQSVLDACAFFMPRLVPGGVMVFDDYGFESCPGAKRAVDEYFAGAMDRPWYLPSGQCVVVKRFA
jgi:O-methyltransferase